MTPQEFLKLRQKAGGGSTPVVKVKKAKTQRAVLTSDKIKRRKNVRISTIGSLGPEETEPSRDQWCYQKVKEVRLQVEKYMFYDPQTKIFYRQEYGKCSKPQRLLNLQKYPLFYDPGSGLFYDIESKGFFDPDMGKWRKLFHKLILILRTQFQVTLSPIYEEKDSDAFIFYYEETTKSYYHPTRNYPDEKRLRKLVFGLNILKFDGELGLWVCPETGLSYYRSKDPDGKTQIDDPSEGKTPNKPNADGTLQIVMNSGTARMDDGVIIAPEIQDAENWDLRYAGGIQFDVKPNNSISRKEVFQPEVLNELHNFPTEASKVDFGHSSDKELNELLIWASSMGKELWDNDAEVTKTIKPVTDILIDNIAESSVEVDDLNKIGDLITTESEMEVLKHIEHRWNELNLKMEDAYQKSSIEWEPKPSTSADDSKVFVVSKVNSCLEKIPGFTHETASIFSDESIAAALAEIEEFEKEFMSATDCEKASNLAKTEKSKIKVIQTYAGPSEQSCTPEVDLLEYKWENRLHEASNLQAVNSSSAKPTVETCYRVVVADPDIIDKTEIEEIEKPCNLKQKLGESKSINWQGAAKNKIASVLPAILSCSKPTVGPDYWAAVDENPGIKELLLQIKKLGDTEKCKRNEIDEEGEKNRKPDWTSGSNLTEDPILQAKITPARMYSVSYLDKELIIQRKNPNSKVSHKPECAKALQPDDAQDLTPNIIGERSNDFQIYQTKIEVSSAPEPTPSTSYAPFEPILPQRMVINPSPDLVVFFQSVDETIENLRKEGLHDKFMPDIPRRDRRRVIADRMQAEQDRLEYSKEWGPSMDSYREDEEITSKGVRKLAYFRLKQIKEKMKRNLVRRTGLYTHPANTINDTLIPYGAFVTIAVIDSMMKRVNK